MAASTETSPSGHRQSKGILATAGIDNPVSELVSDEERLILALDKYVPDTPEERRLVRKIDFILLPCLWWMYILAYLDKGNIVSSVTGLPLAKQKTDVCRQMQTRLVSAKILASQTMV
jgi:hypothetical protein